MTTRSDIEFLKTRIVESILIARSEGVSLEEFLETQNRTAPAQVSVHARVMLLGWAVVLWFETS